MQGTYKFYQEGKLIAVRKNLITTVGKNLILRFMAGQSGSIGDCIAVGVNPVTPTVSDYRLNFEIDRALVTMKSTDTTNQYIIFKATLPATAEYKIWEMGTFSSFSNSVAGEFNGRILTTFDSATETWTNTATNTTDPRTSTDSLIITAGPSATVSARTSANMNLSGYSANDVFTVAFNKTSANITNLVLAFENTTGGSYKLNQSITALPTGYNVMTFQKGSFTATGTIDWAAITQFGVDIIANATGGNLIVDGIRVEDTDTFNPNYALVSRAVLGSPVVKTPVAPMDIEYALDLNIT